MVARKLITHKYKVTFEILLSEHCLNFETPVMISKVGKKNSLKPHRYKDRADLRLSEFFFYPEITFHFHYYIY